MKENNCIDNFLKLHQSNITAFEKEIRSFELKNDNLSLNFDDMNYISNNKISVFLKNIKTREIFKCPSFIKDGILNINLSNLKYLCSDYEYSIVIISDLNNSSTMIYPKFNNKLESYSKITKSSNKHIKWFFRVLENGELMLSTIVLFPNYNNIEENISS